MSNRSSIHFLQLNQREQHLVLNNLSRDFRRKELFNHYLTLYNIKKKALTGARPQPQPQPHQAQMRPQTQLRPQPRPQPQPQPQQAQMRPQTQPLPSRNDRNQSYISNYNQYQENARMEQSRHNSSHVKTSVPDTRSDPVKIEKTAPVKTHSVQTIDLLSGNSGADRMNEIRENLKKVKRMEIVPHVDYK